MGRKGGSSWAVMAADMARTTEREEAPSWASAEAIRSTTVAAELLKRDAMVRVATSLRRAVADEFGVAPRVLQRWIASGGWLHPRVAKMTLHAPPQQKPQPPEDIPAVRRLLELVREAQAAAPARWCEGGHRGHEASADRCEEDAAQASSWAQDAADWLTSSPGDQAYTWIVRLSSATKALGKAASAEAAHRDGSPSWGGVHRRALSLAEVLRGPPKWTGELGPLARLATRAKGGDPLRDAAQVVEVFADLGDLKTVAVLSAAAAAGYVSSKADPVLTIAARSVLESFGASFPRPVFPVV